MIITWYGQACFQITTLPEKNSQVKIVIDPFSADINLKLPKLEADILLISHDHHDHNNVKAVSGNPLAGSGQTPFLIKTPGEYEIKKVFIQAIPAFHDNSQGKERGQVIIYTIESEEMRICHLGDLGQNELTQAQLEKIGVVDILMIPVGGVYTIDAKKAVKVMMQIEPRITIPMHYKMPKLNLPAGGKLDSLDKFLKTLGLKSIEPINKLSVKRKGMSEEEAKIVVLKP